MARKISYAALGLMFVIGGALGIVEWRTYQRSREVCTICERHIHRQAGVIAEIGGHRYRVCCAHCAITESIQENKPLRLMEVTDYSSGRKLDPAHSWYVDGSHVVACTREMTHVNEMKQVENAAFDRCSPGTFAFASQDAADAFAAKNGGLVLSLGELLAGMHAGESGK